MAEQYPVINSPFDFDGEDTLKISLAPYKIVTQSSVVASRDGINKTPVENPLIFLAPSTYSEDTVHEWSNYDSLGTRFVQKAEKVTRLTKDVMTTGAGMAQFEGGNVVTQKLDTPLTFKDSNRRVLNLVFMLSDQGDTERDVFTPVRKLQKWSCAEKGKGIFTFDFPYIFTVSSLGSNLLYIENAALQSVQPTYFGPYRKGYPSRCELTVAFMDIEPLYRKSYDSTNQRINRQYGVNLSTGSF